MFGKLKISSFPFQEPIILGTFIILLIIGIGILSYLTYTKKWKYLWNSWFTTVDHKKIAIMYLILSFLMFIRGFIDAVMMRMQQFLSSSENFSGFLPSHHYDQIFTAHGVIMIFFVAMPLVIGLMNFIIPLQIGARDLAFPTLNSISFWLTVSAMILMNLSLICGEFAKTGWLGYPPLSELQYSPGVGVDYWIWILQISGLGTIFTAINFLVTIFKMRTSGMKLFRLPIFTWASLCTNILILISFPVLSITLGLLTLDRYLNFHFFTNDFGGNMMVYINLIWIWGHPEVYILILPMFGIFSEIVSTFSKKKIFGYVSLVWATIVITVLSFIVWLHHFFTMGSGAHVNTFFSITTMIIAIPTGVKIFNWLFTMYRGRIQLHSSMLWTVGFLITFTIGGMAGVLLAIPPIDFILHNSLFLVAHFHNVIIGGVVFGSFAGLTYWFPKIFGFKLNEKWGIRSFFLWIIGFFVTFMPLYLLGLMGMTRRLSQNINKNFHMLLIISMCGVIFIFLGILSQIIQVYISFKNRKKYIDNTGDPWDGRTLEWSIPSPPPIYNFSILPKVTSKDAFWKMKNTQQKEIIKKKYVSIHIPANDHFGFFLGCLTTIFGFSMVWRIFWLSGLMSISIIILVVLKSFISLPEIIISKKIIRNSEKK
ncbi:cytochrome o ubiquinol oxidase subunit I [Buchnera aphidicola]|uniref:Cytochrome bo(3) ubiquinol oxidase subunit 1 n=1 Tax=Buchnera aphidicola subsp. Tuberolachnus salignus TaxID=98804 RepID=A0A160SW41_BUCTT|nr:cytochrome o ubiquinol oxidase subunit I [Buchnera aphidicola]CUR53277.1 Cytochrome bo(3) ubiquinol oxidase subunit 1 [Buchnera aphidicola (Tuberolachnus salignus)]